MFFDTFLCKLLCLLPKTQIFIYAVDKVNFQKLSQSRLLRSANFSLYFFTFFFQFFCVKQLNIYTFLVVNCCYLQGCKTCLFLTYFLWSSLPITEPPTSFLLPALLFAPKFVFWAAFLFKHMKLNVSWGIMLYEFLVLLLQH